MVPIQITPSASAAPSLPSRLPVLPAGDLRGVDGRAWIVVREHVLAALRAEGSIPLDIEHAHHHDPKAPIAGTMSDFVLSPNGAIDAAVSWTELGARTYAAGGWAISPVLVFDPTAAYGSVQGRVSTISSAALTRTPNFLALALNSRAPDPLTAEQIRICRLMGHEPRDVYPEHYGAIAPNAAATGNVRVLAPLVTLPLRDGSPPERVAVLRHAAPALAKRFAGRTMQLFDADRLRELGNLSAFELVLSVGQVSGDLTAALSLNAAGRAELARAPRLVPGIQLSVRVDDSGVIVDVIDGVLAQFDRLAANSAAQAPGQWPADWSDRTREAFKAAGWEP